MTEVEPITVPEMWDLISRGLWGSLDDKQFDNLQRYLLMTTAMWIGRIDGDIVCVWGVAPPTMMSDSALLWVWATDAVKDHEFVFVRRSQIVIKDLLTRYRSLHGFCESISAASIRWIKWLGGKFGEDEGGYVPFVIRGK